MPASRHALGRSFQTAAEYDDLQCSCLEGTMLVTELLQNQLKSFFFLGLCDLPGTFSRVACAATVRRGSHG